MRVVNSIRNEALKLFKFLVVSLGWEVTTKILTFTFFVSQKNFKSVELVTVMLVLSMGSFVVFREISRIPHVLIKVHVAV